LASNLSTDKILKSNTCLLIGVNPRYEGSKLNLILRSRHLKGNFKVIQIGSLISLTFPNINITSNIKILKSLVEGNNLFCQEFVNSLSPILISNSEIFQRKDSLSITSILKFLIKHVNLFSQFNCQKSQNILNLALNDVGFLNFKNLKTIKKKDFENSAGIFFINNAFLTSNIKKLLNLKLLNFFQNYTRTNRLLITQNNNLNVKIVTQLKKNFNLTNHLHLPNTVLLETAGTYINTEGNINKTTKIITSLGQTKSD
jgi:NADH dehydrogenase/NADH:ubiquinone oxidoreductase subunit G